MKAFSCWGKAQGGWHLLPYHCIDVAACAVTLMRRNRRLGTALQALTGIPADQLERLVGWAAALHDLGKLSPAFQWQAPEVATALGQPSSTLRYDVRHDSLGWVIWQQRIAPAVEGDPIRRRHAEVWLRCATGHHGVPPSRMSQGRLVRVSSYFDDASVGAGIEWARYVTAHFSPDLTCGDAGELASASWWIAGLITLADWLGSSTVWFPYVGQPMDIDAYWNRALGQAEEAVVQSGLGAEVQPRAFAELFPGYTATPVQAAVNALPCKEAFLLIVEEAAGGGKTEAALAAARGADFYFGLPTMATANGLWDRVGHIGGQQALLHSKNWLVPKAMDRAQAWINDSNRKALLASVGVGTVDQAMLGVLHARYNALRLLALARRTLIIDEVHAYDPYMTGILERLIEYHARAGGAVVLLSATMSLGTRQALSDAWARGRRVPSPSFTSDAFPVISYADGSMTRQTAPTSYREQAILIERATDEAVLIERIGDAARAGRCVAWIRNTVREAIESYDRLLAAGLDVDLFHARFTNGDRAAIERRVLQTFGKNSSPETRRGKVLVATQVVEQSLDLDFDLMITDLAPVDLVIQRAGRLHRHNRGERGTPTLLIHAPLWTDSPGEDWVTGWSRGTATVYGDHGRLWLTLGVLGAGIQLPLDARRLVEGVYGPGATERVPVGLQGSAERARQWIDRLRLRSATNSLLSSSQYQADGIFKWEDELAPTRLGIPSREWVVCEAGAPVNGDVQMSAVSLPVTRISRAPGAPSVRKGPWQEILNLDGGQAYCVSGDTNIVVRYDSTRGIMF